MTIPVTLNTVGNLQDTTTAQTVLNANNALVEGGFSTALNVTGDQMLGTLDMNSNQIINLPAPATVNSPARLQDVASTASSIVITNNYSSPFTATSTKTANYTVLTADNNSTITLTGNAYFTVTLNAANNYTQGFTVCFYNADSSRAKWIKPSGSTAFYLWPLQTTILTAQGTHWSIVGSNGKWNWTTAGAIFYMDNTLGTDTLGATDGLASGSSAFLTFTHAWTVIQNYVNQGGNGAVIQAPLSTASPITEQVSFFGAMDKGVSEIQLSGNQANPLLCQWSGTGGTLIQCGDYQSVTINGFNFSQINGSVMVTAHQYGILDCYNCNFGSGAGSNAITAGSYGTANLLTGNSINGNWGTLFFCSQNGIGTLGGPLNITATSNITTVNFVIATQGANLNLAPLTFSGNTSKLWGTEFYCTAHGGVSGDSQVTWPFNMGPGYCISGGYSDFNYCSLFDGASTFSRLPVRPQPGALAVVADSTVSTPGTIVSGGGGGTVVVVFYDSANWRVMGTGYSTPAASTTVITPVYTVTTLNALSPVTGQAAVVTDSTGTTFGATVTGGSTLITPVFYNGSAWRIG